MNCKFNNYYEKENTSYCDIFVKDEKTIINELFENEFEVKLQLKRSRNENRNDNHSNKRKHFFAYTEEQLSLINKINKPNQRRRLEKKDTKDDKKEQLKKEIEKYKPHYKKDLDKFQAKSKMHKFMVSQFPESYHKIDNFYSDVKLLKEKREKHKTKNHSNIPFKRRRVSITTNQTQYKKIWNPKSIDRKNSIYYIFIF